MELSKVIRKMAASMPLEVASYSTFLALAKRYKPERIDLKMKIDGQPARQVPVLHASFVMSFNRKDGREVIYTHPYDKGTDNIGQIIYNAAAKEASIIGPDMVITSSGASINTADRLPGTEETAKDLYRVKQQLEEKLQGCEVIAENTVLLR